MPSKYGCYLSNTNLRHFWGIPFSEAANMVCYPLHSTQQHKGKLKYVAPKNNASELVQFQFSQELLDSIPHNWNMNIINWGGGVFQELNFREHCVSHGTILSFVKACGVQRSVSRLLPTCCEACCNSSVVILAGRPTLFCWSQLQASECVHQSR